MLCNSLLHKCRVDEAWLSTTNADLGVAYATNVCELLVKLQLVGGLRWNRKIEHCCGDGRT